MKKVLFTMFLLSYLAGNSQEIAGKVENHRKSKMDITIMAFGADNPIVVGKVDEKANFSVNLDMATVSESQGSDENMGLLYWSFYFKCMDSNKFEAYKEMGAMRDDYLRLVYKNDWAGTLFLVSDPTLIPWLEDGGYNNAVVGSFYEVLYVREDITLDFTCENQIPADENTTADVAYVFDIELKKGFNWIQYDIEEVYETNPDIRASFPSKVRIRNMQDPLKLKCIGKYY
jgi:hypothetical protein